MSKREERRAELARRLDEGRLSKAEYDRQLARMDERGGDEVSDHRRKNRRTLRRLLERGEIDQRQHDLYQAQVAASPSGDWTPEGDWTPRPSAPAPPAVTAPAPSAVTTREITKEALRILITLQSKYTPDDIRRIVDELWSEVGDL